MKDTIVKALLVVQPSLAHTYRSCQPDDVENSMCFEILGFDIFLDNKLIFRDRRLLRSRKTRKMGF